MNNYLLLAVHFGLLGVWTYSLIYDILFVNFNGESIFEYKGFGGKFKFLTFIGMVSNSIFHPNQGWKLQTLRTFPSDNCPKNLLVPYVFHLSNEKIMVYS